jgi:hypothetical protein
MMFDEGWEGLGAWLRGDVSVFRVFLTGDLLIIVLVLLHVSSVHLCGANMPSLGLTSSGLDSYEQSQNLLARALDRGGGGACCFLRQLSCDGFTGRVVHVLTCGSTCFTLPLIAVRFTFVTANQ